MSTCPVLVWFKLNVVLISTVATAVPIFHPVARFVTASEENTVELLWFTCQLNIAAEENILAHVNV